MPRGTVRASLSLGLSLLLFACGQQPIPSADSPDGTAVAWEDTAPAGKVTALSLTPGENNLYYEPILAAKNGYGPIEIDHSNGEQFAGDGHTLTLNGKTYARGFGTHANSELRYSLQGTGATCTRFTADIGIDDEVGSRGSVVFQVFLDDVKAYDSGKMTGASATKHVNLDIGGKQELRLIVTNAGDGQHYDHADWAVPKVFCQSNVAHPAGSLDTSFGTNGKANVGGTDAVLEPGGDLFISGTVNGDFALKRLSPNGSVRQVLTDFGGQDVANALARQSDGKIVVVGSSDNNFAVARYNPDLSLDASFGKGGKVVTDLGGLVNPSAGYLEAAYAVALQANGKIVLAGTTTTPIANDFGTPDLAVVRYNAGGSLDATFGKGGISVLSFDALVDDQTDDEARAVVIQPDGKLVIAGKADYSGGGRDSLLTRLNANGSLDTAFGTGGFVHGGTYSILNDVALQSGGSIVAVGYMGRYDNDAEVLRYTSNGAPAGATSVRFTTGEIDDENVFGNVLVQGDGKILVGGANHSGGGNVNGYRYAFARLNPDLSLDTSFGTGGKVITDLGPSFLVSVDTPRGALLRQPDGRIVVVGAAQSARFWP